MKVGDRVKYIGFTSLRNIPCIITKVLSGHRYVIEDFNNNEIFSVWEEEVELDIQYYRDIKLNILLNESRG